MCLNKPITIPVGSDGLSVFIAYAQDSSGTGASFTPSSARDYISFITKSGTASLSDFTVWTLFQGNDGINGTNGTGVSNVYVSDGTTAIGGNVYAENTLVVLMTTGTYINAGVIQSALTWNNLTMLNGWAGSILTGVPKYAIRNGFLYLRGYVDASAATSGTFATVSAGNTFDIVTAVSSNADPCVTRKLTLSTLGNLTITTYGTSTYLLDTVVPISIR